MSASARFFDIPELVHEVLLNLPPADVLPARQINPLFAYNIDISTPLGRKLFLLRDPDQGVKVFWTKTPGSWKLATKAEHLQPVTGFIDTTLQQRFVYNPLVLKPVNAANPPVTSQLMFSFFSRDGRFNNYDSNSGTLLRDMQITKPAVTEVYIGLSFRGNWGKAIVENETGITVGDILNALEHELKRWVQSFSLHEAPECEIIFSIGGIFVTQEEKERVEG